jgi:hypothetical protein
MKVGLGKIYHNRIHRLMRILYYKEAKVIRLRNSRNIITVTDQIYTQARKSC